MVCIGLVYGLFRLTINFAPQKEREPIQTINFAPPKERERVTSEIKIIFLAGEIHWSIGN